jgi:hypothetical protein
MVDTFVVAFHDGCWRIGYDGHWYGIYPDERSARRVAMLVASAHPELPTQVAVVRADGSERVAWCPPKAA